MEGLGVKSLTHLLGVVALLAIPIQAGLIVDNGSPNNTSGNEMTQWIQAEDFVLGGATNIQGVRFWGFALAAPGYLGSIVWQIRADAAGSPGGVLFTGTAVLAPVNEGPLAFSGNNQLRFDFDTGGAALAAGTYWLALHNGPLSTTVRDEFYWQTRANNATLRGMEDQAPFDGVFVSNGGEHAFQLFDTPFAAVPEPGSLTLIGSGLLALGFLVRRK